MNEETQLKVPIDTNLVISGMISPNGSPAKLLADWISGKFAWIITDEIFAEIK